MNKKEREREKKRERKACSFVFDLLSLCQSLHAIPCYLKISNNAMVQKITIIFSGYFN